jgi:hypothetical protein
MAGELRTGLTLQDNAPRNQAPRNAAPRNVVPRHGAPRHDAPRARGGSRRSGWGGFGLAGLGLGIVAATTGAGVWAVGNVRASSVGALSTWVGALVLVVAVLVELARKGRHAGWFHPLSLPFAALAIMSLGAPLWVYFTHEPVGLLYDPGYQPPAASTLAVAVSVTCCEALALVVVGYMSGAATAVALTRQAESAAVDERTPVFRRREMRRAGLALMVAGAASQAAVAALARGTAYGAGQTRYGWASILGSGAATALLAGLILVTVIASHTTTPRRLRDLLRGPEWAALGLYALALALTGERAGLIAPIVYLAWAYSTQVRVIPLKWVVAGVLLAIITGSAIGNYRQDNGLSPGSANRVVPNAVADVSSPAWLTQETIINVPSAAPYTRGSTYLAAVESQLPGPVARLVGAPARTASAIFRDIIGFSDPNQGFAESYPSEAYLNFGLVGCLGAGIFLGALMGWAWRKRPVTAARPRDLIYPLLLAGLIYGFRSDALTQIKDMLYPMLLVWGVMGWYRVRSPAAGRAGGVPLPRPARHAHPAHPAPQATPT